MDCALCGEADAVVCPQGQACTCTPVWLSMLVKCVRLKWRWLGAESRSLFPLYRQLFYSLCLFIKHSHTWPPGSRLSVLSSNSSRQLSLPASHAFISPNSHTFFLLYAFPLLSSHTPQFNLTPLSLVPSLASAGSENFLLGENLTVAVLGVVIPIGKSPGALCFCLCVCVRPPYRPAGLLQAAVYLPPMATLFVVHSHWPSAAAR